MASNFAPPVGNIDVIEGLIFPKKVLRALVPRAFPKGTPLWLNKIASLGGATQYIVEPALLSVAGATSLATSGSSTASTYTSVDGASTSCNAAFAPLFVGFALEAVWPQSFFNIGGFSAPYGGATYPYNYGDASRPFVMVADEGIAVAPLLTALTAPVEYGVMVALDGFLNNTTGFYDPAGCLQTDTHYYSYNNAVKTTTTAANAIGQVCERGNVGDTYLKFKFKSTVLSTRLGGI